MSRFRRARETGRSKEGSAGGRLIGLIIILALTAGTYWVAENSLLWLGQHPIEQYREEIRILTSKGPEMKIVISTPLLPITLPIDVFLRIGIAIFLDILVFTILVFGWMAIKPSRPEGPDDPWASQGRG